MLAFGTQSAFKQLNLFDIAAQNERETLKQQTMITPDQFHVRERFHVKWNNGIEFTGTFVTHGWWQEVREDVDYYLLDVGGQYRHPSPALDDWLYLGHDDHYEPPRRDDIKERLIHQLGQVPLVKRIPTF